MILADKIIELRKKNGWSQEELAEKLEVSRQAVSKWESAQSVPDMNRILMLSEAFGVSTDYLLKDELEADPQRGDTLPVDSEAAVRTVSMEEASAYLENRTQTTRRVSLGVMLCILSPILLILLAGGAEAGRFAFSETQAVGLGLIALILTVGAAVALFVITGLQGKRFEYLEKENIETAYGVDGMVRDRREKFRGSFSAQLAVGIVLCVLSVLPVFFALFFWGDPANGDEFPYVAAVAALLGLVAVGVLLILRAAIPWGGFQKLLEEGDYSREKKKENRRNEPITAIYWSLVTAGYLAYSFITNDWQRSWIVWPVAAVAFGVVLAISAAVRPKADR